MRNSSPGMSLCVRTISFSKTNAMAKHGRVSSANQRINSTPQPMRRNTRLMFNLPPQSVSEEDAEHPQLYQAIQLRPANQCRQWLASIAQLRGKSEGLLGVDEAKPMPASGQRLAAVDDYQERKTAIRTDKIIEFLRIYI